jgi:hypothetical protein
VDQQAAERQKHTVIFGAVEKGPNGTKLLLQKAEGKSRNALLPIIKKHILPGTTIVSDELSSYRCLPMLPEFAYTHFTVNHKQNYVNPTSGKHTQGIESQWQKWKEKCVKRPYGVRRSCLDTYLDKHMWLMMYRGRDAMYHFWRQVASLYPCEGAVVLADGEEEGDDIQPEEEEDEEEDDGEEDSASSGSSGIESDQD